MLKDLQKQAGIVGRDVVAADVVKATLARYRWTTAKSILLQEAGSLGRIISEGLVPKPTEGSSKADTSSPASPSVPEPAGAKP